MKAHSRAASDTAGNSSAGPKPGPILSTLGGRQLKFVAAYIRTLNGAAAAREAGYAPRSARITASKLLTNANIAAAVHAAKGEQFRRMHMDADEVLAILAEAARSSMGQFLHLTPDGEPYLDLQNAPQSALANVQEATIEDFTDAREVGPDGQPTKRNVRRVKIKLVNKLDAVSQLMKHLNMLTAKREPPPSEGFVEAMRAAHARAAAANAADRSRGPLARPHQVAPSFFGAGSLGACSPDLPDP